MDLDYLIINGSVYSGADEPPQAVNVGIKGERIVLIDARKPKVKSAIIIDAEGHYVLPGFIDPHTHSLTELNSDNAETRRNLNYAFQGVTTVVNGNDGFGDPDIAGQSEAFEAAGIGTNTAFFIGHGALRKEVMGGDKRAPTGKELREMKDAIAAGMDAGALGLSTGLFYAPGNFSDTGEVIELARIAGAHGGIYDSHIRDESTYNIGLLAAVEEVITISREAEIPANIAHIKALGVDVWGESENIIALVEAAQAEGLEITADQYPWQASGTRISNALIPRWVKAGSTDEYLARLSDPAMAERIATETAENLRKRGGPEAVLITASLSDAPNEWANKTLGSLASENALTPVQMAIHIAKNGDARIASFNMDQDDIDAFMVQDWVMTSSDGSTGHPRKYASYPKKFGTYVKKRKLMPPETFVHKSTGLVAETLNLCERGYIRDGYFADIAIINPNAFAPNADFYSPAELSSGVEYLFVNGTLTIASGEAQPGLPGKVLRRCDGVY